MREDDEIRKHAKEMGIDIERFLPKPKRVQGYFPSYVVNPNHKANKEKKKARKRKQKTQRKNR